MEDPLIACLVPTSPERRKFWPMTFQCFQKQTWPNKELILIDEAPPPRDFPLWAKHIQVPSNTSIGKKLNIGVEKSSANFFHKKDDDDYFSPSFLETLIAPIFTYPGTISLVDSHLIFLLQKWEMYQMQYTLGGGSICFDRKAWEQRKFKNLSFGEDQDFYLQRPSLMRITPTPSNYVLVRHTQNTWKTWSDGKTVEQVAHDRGQFVAEGPEGFFDKGDLDFYRNLRDFVST
jgi:hypothetical protein